MGVSKRFARLPLVAQKELLKRRQERSASWLSAFKVNYTGALRARNRVELLLAKGYNAKRLKARGIGISFLQDSLTPKELIGLGFTDKREFLDRNCGYQALKYRQSGLTAKDLVKLLGFTADELRSRYFGEREIKEAFEK